MILFTFNGIPCAVDNKGVTVDNNIHAPLADAIRKQVSLHSRETPKYYPSLEAKVLDALRAVGTVRVISGSPMVADEDEDMVY